ncbi:EG45-like domain containing protein 2 [Tasmannia lanceolata]|uniref:EG45-like domain containing protein 2 n=1 Tax=Tasmannia lanceolata TaxID=3420 RepID=UPI004063A835
MHSRPTQQEILIALSMRFRVLATLLVLLSKEVILVLGDVGTATSYGPPYTPTKCYGRNQEQFPTGNMFVAVSEGLWDNGAACGRRYRLKCLSGPNKPCNDDTITVEVVDACSKRPCASTILLSKDAFAAISHSDTKINIEYAQI